MDIFLGSNLNIQDNLAKKFESLKELNQFFFESPSSKILMLRGVNGEILYLENEKFEILFDGYIAGKAGIELESSIISWANNIVENLRIDYSEYNGVFNIVIRHKPSGDVWLSSDPSGLLPLYFNRTGDGFHYCSHVHILSLILNSQPDYMGLYQRVHFGYTIGSRTLYKGIFRQNPGEIIRYNTLSKDLKSFYRTVYFTKDYSAAVEPEELFNYLKKSFSISTKNGNEIGLMLSEGFDSRFLGGVARSVGARIESFTHGISGTKGQTIAKQTANILGSNHTFYELRDGFPVQGIREQLLLTDSLNIPFWIHGSEYFRNKLESYPIVVGTALDTTLGGHAFYKPLRPYKDAVIQRYVEIVKQDLGLLSEKYIETLSSSLLKNLLIKDTQSELNSLRKFYKDEVIRNLEFDIGDINDEILQELERLKQTGSHLPSQMLQRFFLEHRARKFSFCQELTLRIYNKIIVPSYEYDFIERASTIHPVIKLHHKFYLEIFKKIFPDLLNIQNGGYGIKPKYPRIILETSRFISKRNEKKRFAKLLEQHGNYPSSEFRSAFVTDYCRRDEEKIRDFEEIVKHNDHVFNREGMRIWFNNIKEYKIRTFNFDRFYLGVELNQVLQNHI